MKSKKTSKVQCNAVPTSFKQKNLKINCTSINSMAMLGSISK